MKLDISPDLKENIYNKYLQEIDGVKFTLREIDVISCVLHNRGEKKIASLLTITYRTVSVHVRNIMNKLGCNSKDYIIDAIEKSGKLQYVRQYYFYLVAELSFIKILQKIAKLINISEVNCTIDFAASNNESVDKKLKKIKEHLSLANINIRDIGETTGDEEINLYVLSEDTIIKKNLPQDHNKVNGRGIALIFDKDGEDLTLLGNMQYVEFVSSANYYFSILGLIRKIIGVDDIEKLIQEFKEEYQSLQNSWKGVGVKQITAEMNCKKSRVLVTTLIIIFISIVIAGSFFINRKTTTPDIPYINKELSSLAKVFSADSITTEEEKRRNYTLVGRVSQIADNFKDQSVQDYFQNGPVTHEEMINCLYILHAIGTHYVYNEHNGIKSRELLKFAKKIAESYVIRQHKTSINFNNLTPEEVYVELSIFKDLPEMYAKIIYLLGKTYMYQGDLKGTEKYYELSKYLGNKLGLFEGYLSTRSGIEMLRHYEINNDIKNKEYMRAQKNLLESIQVFNEMKKDLRQYKMSYRPGNISPHIMVPAKDIHNLLFIDEEIVKAYSMLIMISKEKQQKQEYANKILSKFIGSKDAPGMLVEVKKVVLRRLSSMYNEFGNILLQLEKENLDFQHYKKEIIKILNLADGSNLEITLQVFDLAKSNSRNNEYTKADSYDGLAKAKELMIAREHLTSEQKNKLQAEILDLKAKRDEINLRLKRKTS